MINSWLGGGYWSHFDRVHVWVSVCVCYMGNVNFTAVGFCLIKVDWFPIAFPTFVWTSHFHKPLGGYCWGSYLLYIIPVNTIATCTVPLSNWLCRHRLRHIVNRQSVLRDEWNAVGSIITKREIVKRVNLPRLVYQGRRDGTWRREWELMAGLLTTEWLIL